MPPRPPPSPPVLTVLCCIAAVAASWLSVAIDALARSAIGGMVGVPSAGLMLLPDLAWTLSARQQAASAGPFAWALVVLSGSAAVVLVSTVLAWLVASLRMAGWIRAFALVWSIVGLIWIPTALAAGALNGTRGPGADLYMRLGDPQAGRWSALALGILILAMVAGPGSRRAISGARGWMRADGLEFRRRLVRVVAGWPAAAAILALGLAAGWGQTPWLALWVGVVVGAFQLRTA